MNFHSAVGFVLVGCALFLSETRHRSAAACLAIFGALYGGLFIFEYLFGVTIPYLDLAGHYGPSSISTLFPGRITAEAAVCLFFFSSTLVYSLNGRDSNLRPIFLGLNAPLMIAVATIASISSFVNAHGYGIGHAWYGTYSRMTVFTAVTYALLGLAAGIRARTDLRARSVHRYEWFPLKWASVCVIASVLLWQLVVRSEVHRVQHESATMARNVETSVHQGFRERILSLERMAGRLGAGSYRSREAWDADAALYQSHLSGIRGMAVVGPDTQVKWVFPAIARASTLGFRLDSDPNRIPVIERAIMNRRAAISPLLTLKWGGAGFMVLSPYYQNGRIAGFLNAAIRPREFFQSILDPEGYELRLEEAGKIVYSTHDANLKMLERWASTRKIQIGEGQGEITVWPSPETLRGYESSLPLAIFIGGLGISLLFGIMLEFFGKSLRSEENLRTAKGTLEVLIDSSPLPILTVGEDLRVQIWNPACERVFGWSAEEAIGRPIPFVPIEKLLESEAIVRNILKSSGAFQAEVVRFRKNGTSIDLSIAGMALPDVPGSPRRIMAIMSDISQGKAAERAIRSAKVQAERLATARSDFLANVSHEIRTPLNGVIGMTELLLETHLDAEQTRFAKIVHSSGSNLLRLINDILDLSKIESGKMTMERTRFDLADLVERQTEVLFAQAREKQLTLATFVDPSLSGEFYGDPARIGQVLMNLIGNALKFTAKGGVSVRVIPEADPEFQADELSRMPGRKIRFEVEDSGIGISDEARNRLFQPFTQAETSTTRKYGGTGLGLSICKQLAAQLGGDIGVESAGDGHGSTFWFTIRVEGAGDSRGASALTLLPKEELRSLRLLVIDPDPFAARAILNYAGAWGMTAMSQETYDASRGFDIFDVLLIAEGNDSEGLAFAQRVHDAFGPSAPRMIRICPFHRSAVPLTRVTDYFIASIQHPLRPIALFEAIVRSVYPSFLEHAGIDPSLVTGEVRYVPESDAGLALASEREGSAPSEGVTATTAAHFPVGATPVVAPSPAARPPVIPLGRILVADDVSTNQLLTLKQLEKLGYAGTAVANGREVLEAVARAPYDLILMDCQMPEMDGFTATRELRAFADPRIRNLPIVALTANAMEGDSQRCLEAGMNDYLSKPLRRPELERVLTKFLGHANGTRRAS